MCQPIGDMLRDFKFRQGVLFNGLCCIFNTFARIRKVEYYHSVKSNECSSEVKELNDVRRNPDTILIVSDFSPVSCLTHGC